MMTNRSGRLLIALLAVVALVAAACGSGETAAPDGAPTIHVTVAPGDEGSDSAGNTDDDGANDGGVDTTDTDSIDDAAAAASDDTNTDATDDGEPNDKDAEIADRKGTLGASVLGKTLAGDAEAGSARFNGVLTFVGTPDSEMPGDFVLTFDGAYDIAANASDLTIDFGDLIEAAMAAEGGGGQEMELFAAFFEEPMRVITIGDESWVQWGLVDLFTGQTGGWLEAEEQGSSDLTSEFGFAGSGSPTDMLESLREANAVVTEVGRETVRGVETTHVRAIIDFEALAETLSDAERAEIEEQLGASGIDSLPIDFWIGDDDLIYRYAIELSGAALEAEGELESMSFVFEMYDYGADIAIAPPPADEIISADDFDFGF